jgi:hypothetical protein
MPCLKRVDFDVIVFCLAYNDWQLKSDCGLSLLEALVSGRDVLRSSLRFSSIARYQACALILAISLNPFFRFLHSTSQTSRSKAFIDDTRYHDRWSLQPFCEQLPACAGRSPTSSHRSDSEQGHASRSSEYSCHDKYRARLFLQCAKRLD